MPGPAGVFTQEEVNDMFTYHPTKSGQQACYDAINEAASNLVNTILRECPNCPDRTHAIRIVRNARMWANAAIACEGKF